jgi:hypothetical protein
MDLLTNKIRHTFGTPRVATPTYLLNAPARPYQNDNLWEHDYPI